MKNYKTLLFICISVVIISIIGCGGGGGGSTATNSSISASSLAAGKISYENGSTNDTLHAVVTGTGVSGGWIEDLNGIKLAGSDLKLQSLTNSWEVTLERSPGTFVSGGYVLKYFKNSETLLLTENSVQWTTAPQFRTAPTLSWDSAARYIKVSYPILDGSSTSYYLRIYSEFGTLAKETFRAYGPEITEYLPIDGNYRVVLIGEVNENGKITGSARHVFTLRSFTGN